MRYGIHAARFCPRYVTYCPPCGTKYAFWKHPDAQTAFRRMGAGEYPQAAAEEILTFLRTAQRAGP